MWHKIGTIVWHVGMYAGLVAMEVPKGICPTMDERVFKIYSNRPDAARCKNKDVYLSLPMGEGSYDNHVISEPDLWTMHEEVK